MTKCVFCGKEEPPFKGVHVLGNDGSTKFYCSSKCRHNALILGRDKRRLKWTTFYVKGEAEEASVAKKEANRIEEAKAETAKATAKKEAERAKSEKKAKK